MTTTADHALLDSWGIEDFSRGSRNVQELRAALGSLFAVVEPELNRVLPETADPDTALNSFERFVTRLGGDVCTVIPSLTAGRSLDLIIRVFGTSPFLAEILIADPPLIDDALAPLRTTPTREELMERLGSAVSAAPDDSAVLREFRRFRRSQLLRIGVNDIIRDRPLEEITADLSRTAEAAVETAWSTACRTIAARYGRPSARSAVLAFGKLGGEELNYSSDIDLMVVYDEDGRTDGRRPIGNDEYFARAVSELIRLLSSHAEQGAAYRVDFRLRPEGKHGPLARSLADTSAYYENFGRTWERQALIKMRPIAGDREVGERFTELVRPFVYRRFLSFAEINDIKAMKRRIEQKSLRESAGRDVKTGPGGIRDIEFVIQFLQLLNGGDLPTVRRRDTLGALQALETAGCLTDTEYRGLDEAYRFLRKVEHRLQLLFDLQTHRLPEAPEEIRKLAVRVGFSERKSDDDLPPVETRTSGGPIAPQKHSPLDESGGSVSRITRGLLYDPMDRFLHAFLEKTRLNRAILEHLLNQTFSDADPAEPETDLLLDPDPEPTAIQSVLGKYGFSDSSAAWNNLQQLAAEQRFLSSRRCRHFLAGIAAPLLQAVGRTTDPDASLTNLEKVTASLGGKAILYELFSFNPPSLQLYVDMCDSPFLAQMLINNPGMIDELLDALILNRPRTPAELRAESAELLRGVESEDAVESILHSFQDKETLRIAARQLLGKDDIRAVTAALSDVAETLLSEIAARQEAEMRSRHGEACPYAVLALGKLGGREMSYHSDLDLLLVYESDGRTGGPRPLDHVQYFTELARRLIKTCSRHGPMGRLYAVDMRLRPTGKSGTLVIPLEEFERYYRSSDAGTWERQSLTRARVVFGRGEFADRVSSAIRTTLSAVPWNPTYTKDIRDMRRRLEESASTRSLKRAPGGMMDVEFIAQLLQLRDGFTCPDIVRTNVWDCLEACRTAKLLNENDARTLIDAYGFYRSAESQLRLMTNRPVTEYPESPADLERMARRMRFASADQSGGAGSAFLTDLARHREWCRAIFLRLTESMK